MIVKVDYVLDYGIYVRKYHKIMGPVIYELEIKDSIYGR